MSKVDTKATTNESLLSSKTVRAAPVPGNVAMSAAIIFHRPLVQQLASPTVRIPANYVGVRRVRPSSKQIRSLEGGGGGGVNNNNCNDDDEASSSAKIVFKITDEKGNERRMTKQEKREVKKKLALERKQAKKRQQQENSSSSTTSLIIGDDSFNSVTIKVKNDDDDDDDDTNNKNGDALVYHQLQVNNNALQQELAELRGERNGLPPVLLSPAMALQAQDILTGTTTTTTTTTMIPPSSKKKKKKKSILVYDHNLSIKWAELIKESMKPAEQVRGKESLRPMPYQLIPEPWKRLRPSLVERQLETRERTTENFFSAEESQSSSPPPPPPQPQPQKCNWANIVCRPPTSFDLDASIVFEYLYRETSFHVSCGAKFGSDFLIYDGPRDERHAFAGLRVLQARDPSSSTTTTTNNQLETERLLPIPNAYSLAGYVRCLNTAGKVRC